MEINNDLIFGDVGAKEVESLEQLFNLIPLISNILGGRDHSGHLLFRGQGTPDLPMPGIARNPPKSVREQEAEVINQLRLRGGHFPELAGKVESEIELLIAAQHYGLKTRLLDWTTCLPVALWFALQSPDKNQKFRYLYVSLVPEIRSYLNITLENLDSMNSCFAFQAADTGGRVSAQHSWFTIHPYSDGRYGWGDGFIKSNIMKYKIPIDQRESMLTTLSMLGFNERTVKPDFSGLCSYLNRKHLTID